jgi:AcrR family transcriptional regulator
MALILEKGYDAVTVEDVTNRADLGRTTFYLHYRDKEELLLESIDATANDLKAQVDLMRSARAGGLPQPRPVHLAFRHAAENATLYRIILMGEGATKTASFLRRFISDSAAEYLGVWATRLSTGDPSTSISQVEPTRLRLISDYFASSLLGFLTWWLEADMPNTPEEMADFFIQIFFLGARQFISEPALTSSRNASAAASGWSLPPEPP